REGIDLENRKFHRNRSLIWLVSRRAYRSSFNAGTLISIIGLFEPAMQPGVTGAGRRLASARLGLYPARVELERGCLTPVPRLDDIRLSDKRVGLSEGVTLEKVTPTVGKRHEQAERAVLG